MWKVIFENRQRWDLKNLNNGDRVLKLETCAHEYSVIFSLSSRYEAESSVMTMDEVYDILAFSMFGIGKFLLNI